jgi:hypothetical protein
MEGVIIQDYFGSDNNDSQKDKQNNIDKEEKSEIKEKENNQNTVKEEFPSDMEIIRTERTSIIVIPEEIKLDKQNSNKLTQKMVKKTNNNSQMKLEDFFTKKRHFLIMSDGGKPVYSRYGDPIENNSIFATLSAMITKFTIFNSDNSFKENLNVISNNKNKIVFLKKGQLIFISLSKRDDCTSLLLSQLEYLYNQLMSILTINFYSKLEDNPSKCLSTMSGTEILFEQIIQYSSKSFASLFNAYQVMNYFEGRDKLNKIAEEYRGDALYCIIMSPYEIIALARSNQIDVVSSDIVLIQTLIFCQEMLRSQESYVPICLPGISEQGYIQFYSNFSEENIGVIFVTENQDPMCFVKFQEQYNRLYQRLNNDNYIQKIMNSLRINNNIYGEYTLMKNKNKEKQENKEKKEKITADFIMNELITKMTKKGKIKESTKKLERYKTLSYLDNNHILNKNKINTENNSNVIKNSDKETLTGKESNELLGKTEKLINKVFDGIKYGVVLNKKLRQYILFNFDMDFRVYDKFQKKLIHEYNILYDKANEEMSGNEEFFYIYKSQEFVNVIEVNENFVCICSYNFFSDYDEIGKKTKDLLKYLKKNEYKHFILFK